MLPIELATRGTTLRAVQHARPGAKLLPLMFPTVEHFAERLSDVQHRALSVEGLQRWTILRWRTATRSLLMYFAARSCGSRFITGDYRLQAGLLEDWIGWMRARGTARATIATYWHSLASQLARVEREDGMLNPFSLVPAPKPGVALPRSLTRLQVEALLRLVRNERGSTLSRARNLCLVGLMVLAGLRRGEALGLEVSHCNAEMETLQVVHGKGRLGGRPRTSYMTPQLCAIVSEYLAVRDRAVPERTHAALLTSLAGNRPLNVTAVTRLFRRWSTILGIRITPHALRHSYAMLLRQAGVPDRVSMDLLGHRSLSMLQRYSHVFDGEHRAEAAKVFIDLDTTSAVHATHGGAGRT